MNQDWTKRPLSWSSLSSFEWNKEKWYDRYLLGIDEPPNAELRFGKALAESIEAGKPLVPVPVLSKIEYPLSVMFGTIPLIGYCDSYEPHHTLYEYKSGKKEWDQKRVDEHGQLTMYAFQLFIQHKVYPDDLKIKLFWIPTKETSDFNIEFVKPVTVVPFETKRSMTDILKFGAYINKTVAQMREYVEQRSRELTKIN